MKISCVITQHGKNLDTQKNPLTILFPFGSLINETVIEYHNNVFGIVASTIKYVISVIEFINM